MPELDEVAFDRTLDNDMLTEEEENDSKEHLLNPFSGIEPNFSTSPPANDLPSTDPLSVLCCCGFAKLHQSYVLRDKPLCIVGPHWIGLVFVYFLLILATMLMLQKVSRYAHDDTGVVCMTLGLALLTGLTLGM